MSAKIMGERHARPFGIVEQRELKRLRDLGAKHVHVAALVVLRVRQDPNGEVRDGFASLADWVGMSESTMKRAMRWLVKQHIVMELDREHARDAGRGAAWRWPRRIVPFELWPRPAGEEPDRIPLWREQGRKPTYEELREYRQMRARL
jgi:hypothetical protein